MSLQLQDFPTMVKTQAAAVSASCQQVVDLTPGSIVRALLEANASVGLWIQWLIVRVLAATRAATSTAEDLDTWVADFGMKRLPAAAASGAVTFSRSTPGFAATIPVGAAVRTGFSSNDQVFTVVADPSNAAWAISGYKLQATEISVTVPVSAQTVGVAGNVIAGSVTTIASALPGVDAVTNQSPISGGVEAETDIALRTRFAGFLDSRNRATSQAVGFAISSLRQGISYTIADRIDASGNPRPGHFTVTVDDGSGAPTDAFMEEVAEAIDLVRPIGATFSVRPPLIIAINVQLQVEGPISTTVNVQNAVAAFISSLPIGSGLSVTRLYQIAYDADDAVTNVSGALINGTSGNYRTPPNGLLRPSLITVNS